MTIPRSVSLYNVESEIIELMAMADDEQLTIEERAVVEAQISEYLKAEERKVDGICTAVRICRRNKAAVDEEIARLKKHADAWEAREERIKESTLRAMVEHNVTQLQTATNTLRVQGNGGLEPLEIGEVSDEYKLVNVTLPMDRWKEIGQPGFCNEVKHYSGHIRAKLKIGPVEGVRVLDRGKHLRVE